MAKPYYPVGRYACKIIRQSLGSAGTGTPQFTLSFKVLGQVDPSDPSRYIPAEQEYERTHYRPITAKTIEYLTEDLKILGFAGSSFSDLDPNKSGFHDFSGQDVDMWCAHKTKQDGTEKEEWSVAKQGSKGSSEAKKPESLDSKKVRELDNLFGKHLKGLKPTNGVSKPTPVSSAASASRSVEITEEDVPF